MIDSSSLSPPERVLWNHGVLHPDHIDLDAIANAYNAEVVYRPLEGCEARLLAHGDKAIISINKTLPERQRFSLGHELGHWIGTPKATFLCGGGDIAPQHAEAKGVEAEANSYASQLLLPSYLVVPWMKGKKPTLSVAGKLQAEFRTSLTAAALKLLTVTTTPAMVISHYQGKKQWARTNIQFPYDWNPAYQLHHDTAGFQFAFTTSQGMTVVRTDPADWWISGKGAYLRQVTSQSVNVAESTVLSFVTLI